MGKIWIPGGGGGADVSVVTADASDVIKNKVIVGPDGEPLTGKLELTGTAASSHVLAGATFYNTDAKTKQTGTMAVTSAISFSAAALSATSIRISWTNPSKGPWEGVFIQMSTSGNPGVSGGSRVYTGRGNNATAGASNYVDITGLNFGTTYYFTCTSYCTGLGNGASYNVSAKTTDLVLWNGSSLQNGAKWQSTSGEELHYDYTDGALDGKSLVIKLKYSFNANVRVATASTFYLTPTGAVNGSSSSMYNWTGGKEYVFPFSSMSNNLYLWKFFRLQFANLSSESEIKFTGNVAYVALR